MVNVGIIGCGKIAQIRHLPEYENNSASNIYGIFDINIDRAREIAKKYNCKYYESYQELLADENIDVVSVCTANKTHAEITIAALKSGKHVLCEKPMAITIDECVDMVRASKNNNKKLMIGHNQRFAKAHYRAKQLINDGIIGDVLSFRTTFGHGGPETWTIDAGSQNIWFFDKTKASMGAMGDLGIHKTDLIQYLVGSPIVAVNATVTTLDKKDANGNFISVDDNAFCIYTMKNGVVGTMHASWTFYGQEDNSTIIYGSKGIMRIYDDPAYSIKVITKDHEEILYNIDQIQTNDNQTSSGIIDAFVDCIVNDNDPLISGEEALSAMKAVFAAIESSDKGITIRIEE